MPGPARIPLRLVGLLLLLVGAACLILLVVPGPHAVAEVLGVACSTSHLGPSEQCTTWDAAGLLWAGLLVFLSVGFVLRLVTRPPGRGPLVLDLRRRPRP